MVRRAKVPVIPAVFVGSFDAWPKTRTIFRPAPIRIAYGPPIILDGQAPDEIIAIIDQTLRKMFEDLRDRAGASRMSHSMNRAGDTAKCLASLRI